MADQSTKVKGVVDIAFLLDATGSMQPCIDALKNNISQFIDSLTTRGPNNENPVKHWRAKVVGYRDAKVDPVWFDDKPFVEDAAQLKSQLADLQATGGGDEPESLLDALYKVATMEQSPKGTTPLEPTKWRYRSEAARVVVAFTDATYHEVMTQPAGGAVQDVINVIHTNRIILNLYAPEMPCHDALAAADKSDYLAIPLNGRTPQDALKEFTADQTNFRKTLDALAKSVSQSAATPVL
jgi:hypothetical protein